MPSKTTIQDRLRERGQASRHGEGYQAVVGSPDGGCVQGYDAELDLRAADKIDSLRHNIKMLLLLIQHETDLPNSAENGVTDPTCTIDEGVVGAARIMEDARKASDAG